MRPEQVTTLRRQLWANAYRPVAVCNHDSLRSPGKRPVGSGWQERARLDQPEAATLPASRDALNTGILCDGLRAVDVDIEDRAIASEIGTLLEQMFGVTIVRTRANSAKFLALYRAAEGEPTKRTLTAEAGKVEILGKGQQFVAFGRHASGAELEWLVGSPEDLPRDGLRSVTEAQVDAFFAACRAIIGEAAVEASSAPDARTSSHGLAADLDDIAAAVRVIPPVGVGEWDARNRIGMAIYAATEGSEDGYDILLDWCERLEDFDEAWCEERWANYSKSPPTRAGAGTLIHLAREAVPGWRKPSEPASDGSEFASVAEELPPEDPDAWKCRLRRNLPKKKDEDGSLKGDLANAAIAFRHAPKWRGRLRWNDFTSQLDLDGKPIQDDDFRRGAIWAQQEGLPLSEPTARSGMLAAGAEAHHHPLREHLRALQWDGAPRLDDWLIRHLGAEDDPDGLHRAYGRKWLISAIARAMNPEGASKVDTMLVLEGRQGLKKSSVFEILAGPQEWFTDNLGDITTRAAWENMQGVWIIEFAELSSVTKADVDALKGFMSRKADPFRPAYGFASMRHPRQCVFGGTVNPGSNGYLKDETGARRFWCVECGVGWDETREIDVATLAAERDLLLAEAVVQYDNGEVWYLDDHKLQRAQAVSASSRYDADLWQDAVEDYLTDKHVTTASALLDGALKIPLKDGGPRELRRIGAILRLLKWTARNIRIEGKQRKCYVSPEYVASDGRCHVVRPHQEKELDDLLRDAA